MALPPLNFDCFVSLFITRLKGEPTISTISNYGSQGKSQAQPDGGEGHSVITTGYPVTVLRKAVASLRRSNTKARVTNRNRVRRAFAGPAYNTRLNPLSIISSARILGAYVLKDVCLPREVFQVPQDVVCGRKWLRAGTTCSDRMEEVSRGHGSRRRS